MVQPLDKFYPIVVILFFYLTLGKTFPQLLFRVCKPLKISNIYHFWILTPLQMRDPLSLGPKLRRTSVRTGLPVRKVDQFHVPHQARRIDEHFRTHVTSKPFRLPLDHVVEFLHVFLPRRHA